MRKRQNHPLVVSVVG